MSERKGRTDSRIGVRNGSCRRHQDGRGRRESRLRRCKARTGGKALAARGLTAAAVALDISEPDQVNRAVEFTVETFGKLDVLHNNAAIFSPEVAADDSPVA